MDFNIYKGSAVGKELYDTHASMVHNAYQTHIDIMTSKESTSVSPQSDNIPYHRGRDMSTILEMLTHYYDADTFDTFNNDIVMRHIRKTPCQVVDVADDMILPAMPDTDNMESYARAILPYVRDQYTQSALVKLILDRMTHANGERSRDMHDGSRMDAVLYVVAAMPLQAYADICGKLNEVTRDRHPVEKAKYVSVLRAMCRLHNCVALHIRSTNDEWKKDLFEYSEGVGSESEFEIWTKLDVWDSEIRNYNQMHKHVEKDTDK